MLRITSACVSPSFRTSGSVSPQLRRKNVLIQILVILDPKAVFFLFTANNLLLFTPGCQSFISLESRRWGQHIEIFCGFSALSLYTLQFVVWQKETQTRKEGSKGGVFLLVSDWCVSIRILMRLVYKNPEFSSFGTTNLLVPAKPFSFGERFFTCPKIAALFQLFFSEQLSSRLTLVLTTSSCFCVTVLVRTPACTISFNCSFKNKSSRYFGSTVCFPVSSYCLLEVSYDSVRISPVFRANCI